MKPIEVQLRNPFDSIPARNILGKTPELKIKVHHKVFFYFDPEAFLNPDGPFGQYKIEFSPEGREPFTVVPEPENYYTVEQAVDRAKQLLLGWNVRAYLQYQLFGEKPTSEIGFK